MPAGAPTLILNVKGNSLDDGPGIRSVIFFKGCPLSCAWCHNPESQKREAELSFDPKKCVGCDTCLPLCPRGALSRQNPGFVDRGKCDLCFLCARGCPSGALEELGRERALDEVLEALLKDKPFYDASGGGVTLSGGEPTLNAEFLSGLLPRLSEKGVPVLLETCGLYEPRRFEEEILPHLGAVYFDLKVMDEAAHRRFCGAGNRVILENFRRLAESRKNGRPELTPRMPLVPGITATPENVAAAAAFVAQCGLKHFKLLAYNPLWPEKMEKIGRENPAARDPALGRFMPADEVAALKEICRGFGLETP